ncbi:MAG: PAC2 family protein [Thaumarchaeota archaeon]|nr:PAC2 family protein [Candidatus Calditenuaceae archaeon]MDW8041977.1 PAC2 family protein [Nitrososphaerota archaeon]
MEFRVRGVIPRTRRLIAALPDMGNVAGIAMEHLVKCCGLEELAAATGEWPPFVVHTGRTITFERGWYKLLGRDGYDFVVFTGSYQPPESTALFELCERVLDLAQSVGVDTVISLGAAHTGESRLEDPRVFYAATSDRFCEVAERAGAVPLSDEGYITGFNGLIHGLAMERQMEGLCLLGEIDDPRVRQPGAARAVLRILSDIVQVKLDLRELDEEIARLKAERALRRSAWRRGQPGVM